MIIHTLISYYFLPTLAIVKYYKILNLFTKDQIGHTKVSLRSRERLNKRNIGFLLSLHSDFNKIEKEVFLIANNIMLIMLSSQH